MHVGTPYYMAQEVLEGQQNSKAGNHLEKIKFKL